MDYLSIEQINLLKESIHFKQENQVKAIYPYWFQSVIIQTNNNKYYQITSEGTINTKTYHDVIFDEGEPFNKLLEEMKVK